MGILDRVFGSIETIAAAATVANSRITRKWRKYLETVPEKQRIINSVMPNIARLKELLNTELVDLKEDESAEKEIIRDFKALKLKHHFNAAEKLSQTLNYAETKYEYILGLLLHIHSILIMEFRLASALERSIDDGSNLIHILREQIQLEIGIIGKIRDIDKINGAGTFNRLFLDIVKGQQFIKQFNARERRLIQNMTWYVVSRNQRMLQSMNYKSDLIDTSLFNRWGMEVKESLAKAVDIAVAKGLMHYHPDADFEFVNKSMFEELVRAVAIVMRNEQAIASGKKKLKGFPSKRMVDIFVDDFRQWFNSEGLRAA